MRGLAIVAACAAALALPPPGEASHRWGPEPHGFHWARANAARSLHLTVDQAGVWGGWAPYDAAAIADWNAYTRGILRLSQGGRGADIRVANANLGESGLLAVSSVRLDQLGHIVYGEVLLNDFYYYPGSPYLGTERQVYCQELGHAFGLDHNRDGILGGSPDDTCMNDTTLSFPRPNGHDYRQLREQYAHADGYDSTAGGRENQGARVVVTHATPARATITGIVPIGPWLAR